jgi:hypothetical protein
MALTYSEYRSFDVVYSVAMEISGTVLPCQCCHSLAEFAANHCPQCHSLKTFNLSKLMDKDIIYFCSACCLTFDLQATVSKYL